MMDRIFVDNLRLDCLIGVTEEERRQPQKIIVDMDLTLDLGRAAISKRIEDTVDYREVRRQVSGFVSSGEFMLLESLAEGIASLALDRFKIDGVVVKLRKEKYAVEPSIGIEIERIRGTSPRSTK
jgi:FolB domain-containing protein